MSPEGSSTSFISNMGYLKRYGSNIFGMTGTLGSEDSRKLLQDVYNIDVAFMPTYKEKQFIELEGIVAGSEREWLTAIIETNKEQLNAGRAVLVICETIEDVKKYIGNLKVMASYLTKLGYTR